MRIAYMGTPEFAVPPLQRLLDSGHEVCMVVSQPDRPKGRGRTLEPTPVKALAETRDDIAIVQPEKIRESNIAELMRSRRIDIAVVVAYGQILPKEILDAPRLGCINIHASLLPAWRGAAPIQRCIMAGESRTGVTIMQLDEGMDTGPVVAQQEVEILPDDDSQSVSDMLSVLGADMVMKVLDDAQNTGALETTPQDHEKATHAPMIRKDEGRISWHDETDEIICKMRALTPWPGAYTELNGDQSLTLLRAEPLWINESEELGELGKAASAGMIVQLKKGFGPVVRTNDGFLLITRLKPAGKAAMDGAAFLNGRMADVGDMLG